MRYTEHVAGNIQRFLLTLLLLAAPAVAQRQQSSVRSYPLPEHGAVEFKIPSSWNDEIQQVKGILPPTITWTPRSDDGFRALVAVGWQEDKPGARMSIEDLKQRVEASMAALESRPANDPEVQELNGATARGYYFSATDRESRPGEFKHLTQGIVLVGELIIAFSIFTNDGQQDVVAEALSAIGDATHRQP